MAWNPSTGRSGTRHELLLQRRSSRQVGRSSDRRRPRLRLRPRVAVTRTSIYAVRRPLNGDELRALNARHKDHLEPFYGQIRHPP